MKKSLFLFAVFAAAAACVGAAFAGIPDAIALLPLGQPDALTAAQLLGFAAAGSIKQLHALQTKRKTTLDAMTAITTAAAAREDGMLTDAERTQFDAHSASIATLDGDIGRVKAQIEATRGGTSVEIPDGQIHITDNLRESANHGFRSFSEFAMACVQASGDGVQADQRLQIGAASTAPGSYGNTASGADGGYLVPPEFSQAIVTTAYNENQSFVPLTDNTPVTGNSMTFPVDETTPWGSAGIKAYWTDEAGAGTESKGKFDPDTLRLKKLTALVPLTEEMLSDSSALASYVQRKVPEAIAFKTNEALWNGSGAGKPKGYYSASGLLVSVAKETSQAADTIVAQNISKMRARMSSRSWRNAIWCINNDALPQLDTLLYATAATNGVIYKPEGGRFGYGTLLGRDVMVTDFNETVGDKGDIVLVDWSMYRTITKAGGMETATSMHFWFDRGLTAFRTLFRIDGQPSIQAPVTPNKGSNTLSPIVTLDARA
jgi:HK97 family phage major capsid protein